MKTVYKYKLGDAGGTVLMPYGANIVHVGYQHNDVLTIWAEVDTEEIRYIDRSFAVYGTGWPITAERAVMLATLLVNNGEYVWHVYETTKSFPYGY